MAAIIRRYVQLAATDAELQATVEPTAAVDQYGTGFVDVQVDDSIDGIEAALDEFMATKGFAFDSQNPATQMGPVAVSPDGTKWEIKVDNVGAITAAAL